jgi:hypothetical protein
MVAFQIYSLMYRYAVLHNNKNVYHFFMSKIVQTVLILGGLVVAVGSGFGFYLGILGPEVRQIRHLINKLIIGFGNTSNCLG